MLGTGRHPDEAGREPAADRAGSAEFEPAVPDSVEQRAAQPAVPPSMDAGPAAAADRPRPQRSLLTAALADAEFRRQLRTADRGSRRTGSRRGSRSSRKEGVRASTPVGFGGSGRQRLPRAGNDLPRFRTEDRNIAAWNCRGGAGAGCGLLRNAGSLRTPAVAAPQALVSGGAERCGGSVPEARRRRTASGRLGEAARMLALSAGATGQQRAADAVATGVQRQTTGFGASGSGGAALSSTAGFERAGSALARRVRTARLWRVAVVCTSGVGSSVATPRRRLPARSATATAR